MRFADDDVCIGPPPGRLSYLNIPRIIAAAEITGADAIHPGYGFLAENAEFAETCGASNITLHRPHRRPDPPDGRQGHGAPAGAGSRRPDRARLARHRSRTRTRPSRSRRASASRSSSRPRPAAAGRACAIAHGRRAVRAARSRWRRTRRWPRSATASVYVEKYLAAAAARRDPGHGRLARQRGPPGRARLLGAAAAPEADRGEPEPRADRRAARADGRGGGRAGVERSATSAPARSSSCSMPTGQLLLHGDEHPHPGGASGDRDGDRLRPGEGADPRRGRRARSASRATVAGCAATRSSAGSTPKIPTANFQPSPGHHHRVPPAGRARACGWTPTSTPATRCRRYYDSLLAKVIVHGNDREEALTRMGQALDSFILEGVTTTIPFLARVIRHPDFVAGEGGHPLPRAGVAPARPPEV